MQSITNETIECAIKNSPSRAQKTVDFLGMKDLLQKNNYWENLPSPVLRDEDLAEDPDD